MELCCFLRIMILPVCILNTDYWSFKVSFIFRQDEIVLSSVDKIVTVFFNKFYSCSLQEGKLATCFPSLFGVDTYRTRFLHRFNKVPHRIDPLCRLFL